MEKLLLKPHEVSEQLGIGRSRTYELLASGELTSIRIGKSIRVTKEALHEFVQKLQQTRYDGE